MTRLPHAVSDRPPRLTCVVSHVRVAEVTRARHYSESVPQTCFTRPSVATPRRPPGAARRDGVAVGARASRQSRRGKRHDRGARARSTKGEICTQR